MWVRAEIEASDSGRIEFVDARLPKQDRLRGEPG